MVINHFLKVSKDRNCHRFWKSNFKIFNRLKFSILYFFPGYFCLYFERKFTRRKRIFTGNPFWSNAPFLCPLKMSENIWLSVLKGLEMENGAKIGQSDFSKLHQNLIWFFNYGVLWSFDHQIYFWPRVLFCVPSLERIIL